ncbi:MAG: hypothetical protein QOE72_3422 [Chloroflexota bacterium]|jgi:hypothetical protein|nr:hypothetical protein [Chloroflexota bacterium]
MGRRGEESDSLCEAVSVAAAVLENRLDALLCRPAVTTGTAPCSPTFAGNAALLTFLEERGIPATNWAALSKDPSP